MGHIRLPRLARTRRWKEVVGLLDSPAGNAPAVASATLSAVEKAFVQSGADRGLVRAVWLLAQLPVAARSGDFRAAAMELGIRIPDSPTVADISAGLSGAIDDYLGGDGERSDIGEIALGAAVEAVSRNLHHRTASLFPDTDEPTRATAALGTEVQFGRLARDFFARLTKRCLNSFVDRELPLHTGEERRFRSLAEQRDFSQALDVHCQQASKIIEAFAGGWWSKARHENDLTEQRTARFVSYALRKLRDELHRGKDS